MIKCEGKKKESVNDRNGVYFNRSTSNEKRKTEQNKPLNLNNKHAVCYEKLNYLFIHSGRRNNSMTSIMWRILLWIAINKMEKREAELNRSTTNAHTQYRCRLSSRVQRSNELPVDRLFSKTRERADLNWVEFVTFLFRCAKWRIQIGSCSLIVSHASTIWRTSKQ